jgi:hypothetical protein
MKCRSPIFVAMFGALAAALVPATAAHPAHAQVNIEPLRKKIAERGVSGSIDASTTILVGNTNGTIASGTGQGGFANETHLAFLVARGDRTFLNDKLAVARTFLHARYNLTLLGRWLFAEAFVQQQTDAKLLLRDRELGGLGARVSFVTDKVRTVVAGLSAMLEYERINVPEGAPDDPETLFLRANAYAGLTLTPEPHLTFSAMTYLQPRIARPSDHRVLVELLFETAIGKGFSVKITSTIRYDSMPVTGLKRTDAEVRNAIAWSF